MLIGVKDNGTIRGIRSDEEKFMLEHAADHFCQPKVEYVTKVWEIDEKVVLEVTIPYDRKLIHKAPDNDGEYKAYVRVKDQNLLASGVLMKVWTKRKANRKIRFVYSRSVQEVLFYLRENPRITLGKAMEVSGLSKFKAEHLMSDLILLDIIKMDQDEYETSFSLIPVEE